jgi:type I restriction enzyme S subunit
MESIESGTGQLAQGELAKTPEAPEANSFRFTPAHVLYGKLRPYLNKVFAPDFQGKCSTELVPLLPNERLDRRYLAYFLRSPGTVEAISQKVAGARMPRADMSFVMSLPIPILALKEQQRIVDLLSRSENIVRMRREAEQKAKEIIPALFLDMFGDPATNPKGWTESSLGQVTAEFRYGSSQKSSAIETCVKE